MLSFGITSASLLMPCLICNHDTFWSATFDVLQISPFSTLSRLFVCCRVFQLKSMARIRFRVTPQRGSGGNGLAHQTHLSSLLSYLAGEDGDTHFLHLMCLLYARCQVSTCSFLTVIFHLKQAARLRKPMYYIFAIHPPFIIRLLS